MILAFVRQAAGLSRVQNEPEPHSLNLPKERREGWKEEGRKEERKGRSERKREGLAMEGNIARFGCRSW